MSRITSLIVSLVASSAVTLLSHYTLAFPPHYTALTALLVFVSTCILLSNSNVSSRLSSNSSLNNHANNVYNELTSGTTQQGQPTVAAANKKKNKLNKVVSQKTNELNERVNNTVNTLKENANEILPVSANTAIASLNDETTGTTEQSSKKKKKKSKKARDAAAAGGSGAKGGVQQNGDDDDDTLDISHHPSLSGAISGGKTGKKSIPILSKPTPTQQQSQSQSSKSSQPSNKESEAAVAKREAQAKLKEQAELKAKIDAEKRQQQIDAAEGWTSTVSRKKDEQSQQPAASSTAAQQPQTNSTDQSESTRNEIKVDSRHQALIIGPKGKHLNDIQQGTGARIQMPTRDSGNNVIVVTGTGAQVHYASAMIHSLITRGYSSLTHPNTVHDDITIPESKLGVVIGPGGSNIKAIQTTSNTRINIPERGSANPKTIIVGSKDGVKLARAALKQLMTDGFSTLTHEGYVREEVEFPTDKHAYLIGPKGQTIKSIQGNTQTKIHLPAANNPNKNVVVIGPENGVKQAIKEIRRLLVPREAAPSSAGVVNGDEEYEGDEPELDEEAQQYTYNAQSTQPNAWSAQPPPEQNEDELWQ